MASRGFFGYDPYDYYYTTPSYNYPYPYYQRHPAAASAAAPAPARARDDARGFFPNPAEMAADVRPCRPRSVSVPVHFVGSDPEPDQVVEARRRGESSRRVQRKRALGAEEAAVRIQAVARGCVARRMVREVRAVEAEAEGMARKVAAEAEALRGDARGRIAVGEGLMRLLLRLDAVHGAREYRRRVTRRVLALQDAVDALEHKPAAQEEAAALPEVVEAEKENNDMAVAEQDAEEKEMEMAPEDEHHTEMEEKAEVVEAPEPEAEHGAEMEDKSEVVEAVVETAAEMEVDATGERPIGEPAEEAEELVVDGEQPPPQEGEDEGEWEMVTEESAAAAEPVDGSATAAATAAEARQQEEDKEKEKKVVQGGDGVETRKVMEMVAALCERSAQQCAVIGALAERVDSLERAVRRVEDAERRRRRSKKLKKEGKGNNAKTIDPSCYSD